MVGISRHTGLPISNLESAYQGVEVILMRRIGSLILRREFGAGIVELLGRKMTPNLFAAFQSLIATAIDLWEPRFQVRRVSVTGSTDEIRLGRAGFVILADFRPRGHLGDQTVERAISFSLSVSSGKVLVKSL
ncbi:GPW/gp25 family protein [Brucella sp. TWI559]